MTTNHFFDKDFVSKVLGELDLDGAKRQLGEEGVQYVKDAINNVEGALKGEIAVPNNPLHVLQDEQSTIQTHDSRIDTGDLNSEDKLEVEDFLPFFFEAALQKDENELGEAILRALAPEKISRTGKKISDQICLVSFSSSPEDNEDDADVWSRIREKTLNAWKNAALQEVATIKIVWKGAMTVFTPPFTKSSINNLVANRKVDKGKLMEHLKNKMLPLSDDEKDENGMKVLRVVPPDVKFVSADPQDPSGYFELDETDQIDNKGYAVVVAGESGSGKSVFACQQSLDSGFVPVYCLVKSDHMKSKPPDTRMFDNLNAFLQSLIDEVTKRTGNHTTSEVRNGLYQLKFRLNQSRNKWATEVLKTLLEELTSADDYAQSWFAEGIWDHNSKPEKVAIVVDEATDIDLAEGLVATVRETMKNYKYLAQQAVLLVIVGVGLDAIRDKDAGYSGRVGTNPEYSKLITMTSPDLEEIRNDPSNKIPVEVFEALGKGLFSRVLMTNARMLFRSVLPNLASLTHRRDGIGEPSKKKTRYEQRLVKMASYGPYMDHGARYYVTANSVKNLTEVLLQAFAYHLAEAIQPVAEGGESTVNTKAREMLSLVGNLQVYKNIKDDPSSNIFSKGLASRTGTSKALKYLSTFGLTCELRESFGDQFEELAAVHYMRFMELHGYTSFRVTLKHAWPPKKNKKSYRAALADLAEILMVQEKSELVGKNALPLHKWLGTEEKVCFVFSQGTPTAQGGGVLFLLVDFGQKKAELETMQCKHFKTQPGEKKCRSWWNSVGVKLEKNKSEANFKPTGCSSAAYSYLGLESFRHLLERRLNDILVGSEQISVQLGNRSLAILYPAPEDFPIPVNGNTRVWFREMFEPTISVLDMDNHDFDDEADEGDNDDEGDKDDEPSEASQ